MDDGLVAEREDYEARLIEETGDAALVAAIVEPVAMDLGYRLVRVRISGQNGKTVHIFAEKPDGTMNVEDCETLSKTISPVLDVDDPIDGGYHLEVSSPGIDRALVRKGDFERWAGYLAKIETSVVLEGRRRFRGIIDGVDGDYVEMALTEPLDDGSISVELAFAAISEARLVLTDDLIKAALRADKLAGKAEKETVDLKENDSGAA